jgi:hypothetical protein
MHFPMKVKINSLPANFVFLINVLFSRNIGSIDNECRGRVPLPEVFQFVMTYVILYRKLKVTVSSGTTTFNHS